MGYQMPMWEAHSRASCFPRNPRGKDFRVPSVGTLPVKTFQKALPPENPQLFPAVPLWKPAFNSRSFGGHLASNYSKNAVARMMLNTLECIGIFSTDLYDRRRRALGQAYESLSFYSYLSCPTTHLSFLHESPI